MSGSSSSNPSSTLNSEYWSFEAILLGLITAYKGFISLSFIFTFNGFIVFKGDFYFSGEMLFFFGLLESSSYGLLILKSTM